MGPTKNFDTAVSLLKGAGFQLGKREAGRAMISNLCFGEGQVRVGGMGEQVKHGLGLPVPCLCVHALADLLPVWKL